MTTPKPAREPHRATPPEVLALIGAIESERDAEIKNLLRRCGVTADLNDHNTFWIQFQAVGLQDLRLTQQGFEDGYLQVEIIAMLERRVFEIERAAALLQAGAAQRSVPQSFLRSRPAGPPRGSEPAPPMQPPIEPVAHAPISRSARVFIDEAHQHHVEMLESVLTKIGWESLLAERPALKKTSVTDYKAGRLKRKVSPEKRAVIEAEIRASATVHLNSD